MRKEIRISATETGIYVNGIKISDNSIITVSVEPSGVGEVVDYVLSFNDLGSKHFVADLLFAFDSVECSILVLDGENSFKISDFFIFREDEDDEIQEQEFELAGIKIERSYSGCFVEL
jgi:hypothetical protein